MAKTLRDRIAQFAPTELTFDESLLSDSDRRALRKIVEASRSIAVLPVDIEPLFPIEAKMRDW